MSRKKVVPFCSGRRYNEGRNRSVSNSCRYANGVSVRCGVRGSLARYIDRAGDQLRFLLGSHICYPPFAETRLWLRQSARWRKSVQTSLRKPRYRHLPCRSCLNFRTFEIFIFHLYTYYGSSRSLSYNISLFYIHIHIRKDRRFT